MCTDSTTHYEIIIEHDDSHALHVQSDVRMGRQLETVAREEMDNLEDGTWTAYGVTVAAVCDCCGGVVREYVSALWGVVVEQDNATGRYDRVQDIGDEYLREIALDVLNEAPEWDKLAGF